MVNKTLIIYILSVLLLQNVQAEEKTEWTNDVYIGGSLGTGSLYSLCEGSPIDCKEHAFSYSGYLGYQILDDLSFEVEAINFGDYSLEQQSGIKQNGAIKGILPSVKYRFYDDGSSSFFASVGVLAWRSNITGNSHFTTTSYAPSAGLHYQYQLNDNWRLGAAYQVFGPDFSVESTILGRLSLNVEYRFGHSTPTKNIPIKKEKPIESISHPIVVENDSLNETLSPVETNIVNIEKPTPEPVEINWQEIPKHRIYFDTASTVPINIYYVDNIIYTLKQVEDLKVRIEGHTDSDGSLALNKKYGLKRAESVAKYLVNKGIKPSLISVVSIGEVQPIATNSTRQGRALNRRVEAVLYK